MTEVINDPQIIFALLKVSANLTQTIENINTHLNMSNPIDCLLPQVHSKNIFENCRSALDYITHLIVKKYEIQLPEDTMIYFPFYKTKKNYEKNIIVKFLKENKPNLYKIILDVQPFNENPDYCWLKKFIEFNNKYKHQGFIPLERRFDTQGGGWFSVSPGGGCGIVTMNLTEEGSGKSTVTSTDMQNDRNIKFRFVFDNGEELIPFLRKMIDGTYFLVDNIFKNI